MTTRRNDFPTDDSINAAANRAEAVLSIYSKAKPTAEWGGWQEMLTQAIADLAILSQIEANVAHAEARADGESGGGGYDAGLACEHGADLAETMFKAQERSDLRSLYEEGGVA